MTTIIFDWDDTLCPSTYLMKKNYDYKTGTIDMSNQTLIELTQFETVIIRLLLVAIYFGTVYIVTNADIIWVNSILTHIFPNLNKLMNIIPIISARNKYGYGNMETPNVKKLVFQDIVKQTPTKTLISFGDLDWERLAVLSFKGQLTTKSIKLVKEPQIQILQNELLHILYNFKMLYNTDSDLDITF